METHSEYINIKMIMVKYLLQLISLKYFPLLQTHLSFLSLFDSALEFLFHSVV